MITSYTPAHEHSNALLMDVQLLTVDCCAAEMLQTFVEGPRPLANLDDAGKASKGISDNFSVTEIEVDSLGSPSIGDSIGKSIAIVQHPKNVGGKNVKNNLTDLRPPLFIVVFKVTQVLGGLRMLVTVFRSVRDSSGGSI